MKFLVDAQLPRRIAFRLCEAGYDAVHAFDLPRGNRTSDAEILLIAVRDHRVVITKDEDFLKSYLLSHQPEKPFLISAGNITNTRLEALLILRIAAVVTALATSNFVELTRNTLIIHS